MRCVRHVAGHRQAPDRMNPGDPTRRKSNHLHTRCSVRACLETLRVYWRICKPRVWLFPRATDAAQPFDISSAATCVLPCLEATGLSITKFPGRQPHAPRRHPSAGVAPGVFLAPRSREHWATAPVARGADEAGSGLAKLDDTPARSAAPALRPSGHGVNLILAPSCPRTAAPTAEPCAVAHPGADLAGDRRFTVRRRSAATTRALRKLRRRAPCLALVSQPPLPAVPDAGQGDLACGAPARGAAGALRALGVHAALRAQSAGDPAPALALRRAVRQCGEPPCSSSPPTRLAGRRAS